MLVTKYEPEAVEQQGSSRGERRETLNSRLENLRQNAESAKVSDIGLTTGNFMIYCFYFEATLAVFSQPNILFTLTPPPPPDLPISFIYCKDTQSFVIQYLIKDKIKSNCFLMIISKPCSGKAVITAYHDIYN